MSKKQTVSVKAILISTGRKNLKPYMSKQLELFESLRFRDLT
jgi:hypothetical protein